MEVARIELAARGLTDQRRHQPAPNQDCYHSGGATGQFMVSSIRRTNEWFDYLLKNDPRFLRRVEKARNSIRAGRGVRLNDGKLLI